MEAGKRMPRLLPQRRRAWREGVAAMGLRRINIMIDALDPLHTHARGDRRWGDGLLIDQRLERSLADGDAGLDADEALDALEQSL